MAQRFGAAELKAALCGATLLLLAGCSSSSHDAATAGPAGQMTPPPVSSAASTTTTTATAGADAAKPVKAPEESHWKMHIDDRTLICNDYDRGGCDY